MATLEKNRALLGATQLHPKKTSPCWVKHSDLRKEPGLVGRSTAAYHTPTCIVGRSVMKHFPLRPSAAGIIKDKLQRDAPDRPIDFDPNPMTTPFVVKLSLSK